MQVAKWGNSLAHAGFLAIVVEALDLKVGDDIEISAPHQRSMRVETAEEPARVDRTVAEVPGRMPPDFKFDRLRSRMSAVDAFFDSNVLLYAGVERAAKAARARALLDKGGSVSVQVLNEFASVARGKFGMELAARSANFWGQFE